MPVILATQGAEIRRILPSKQKALSSNPSTGGKKKWQNCKKCNSSLIFEVIIIII
jgi:hypothetical protein